MARNNFQYEKRQRELEKKRKADDKAKRKLDAKNEPNHAEAEALAPPGDGMTEAAGEGRGSADDARTAPSSLA